VQRLASRSRWQRCEVVRLRLRWRLCCGSCAGVPPNSPRFGVASPARGGEESQGLGLGSAGEPRWATGETPMGVGSKASLSTAAAGSLPRLGVCPTARVSAESQRARVCWPARSHQPRCEAAWPRLQAGLCCKAVRACREISLTQSRQAAKS